MGRRFKRLCIMLITAALLLNASGCWDRRELDALGIVLGVGLDQSASPGEIEMTVQLADVGGQQSKSASSSDTKKQSEGGSNYFNEKGDGKDVLAILQKAARMISRKLYFAHNQVIIFGKELAKEGVRDSFDFFARYPDTRMTVYMFVAREKAGDIFDIQSTFGEIPASEISALIQDPVGSIEKTPVFADEFAQKLISDTTSAVVPIIEVKESESEKHCCITGCAVFKGDKLVGELDEKEVRGYKWITGETRHSKLDVEIAGETAGIIITSAKGKFKSEITDDGSVIIKVKITGEGSLDSQTGTVNLADPQNIKLLKKEAERTVKQEIEKTVNKTCALGTDIFGFGESVHRRYPQEWEALKPQWDEIYKDIEVQIDVTLKVIGSGKIVRPLYPEKK